MAPFDIYEYEDNWIDEGTIHRLESNVRREQEQLARELRPVVEIILRDLGLLPKEEYEQARKRIDELEERTDT